MNVSTFDTGVIIGDMARSEQGTSYLSLLTYLHRLSRYRRGETDAIVAETPRNGVSWF